MWRRSRRSIPGNGNGNGNGNGRQRGDVYVMRRRRMSGGAV